jgi:hypothetical protein
VQWVLVGVVGSTYIPYRLAQRASSTSLGDGRADKSSKRPIHAFHLDQLVNLLMRSAIPRPAALQNLRTCADDLKSVMFGKETKEHAGDCALKNREVNDLKRLCPIFCFQSAAQLLIA